jgi:chromosome segregation ATPase
MSTPLRRLARALYDLPLVGRVVRWASVLLRLPALQDRVAQLAQTQADLRGYQLQAQQVARSETEAVQARTLQLDAALAQLAGRISALEAGLQRLESSASLILEAAATQDNLTRSVPVALRRSARDIAALREQLAQLQSAADAPATKEPA